MMPEVGHFALILSMVLALVQAGVPLTAVPIRPGTVGVWLAKEQAGDKAAALDDWVALPNDLPGDEEWAPDLKQRIGELTFDSNFDAARKIRPPDEAAESDALGRREEEEGAERAGSPPPERLNARVSGNAAVGAADCISKIRGMVDGLAARLAQSPRDPEGWIALIRCWTLFHETDAARQAVDRAFVIFSDSPQEQRPIAAAAEEVGLTQ